MSRPPLNLFLAHLAAPVAVVALAAAAVPVRAFPQAKYPVTMDQVRHASSKAPVAVSSQPPADASTPAATPVSTPKPTVIAGAPAPKPPVAQAAAKGAWSVYVIQPRDTLSGVSRRFGASVKTLGDINELEPKAPLRAGSRLKLPPGTVDGGKDPYASGPSPAALASVSPPAPHKASAAKPSAKGAKLAAKDSPASKTTAPPPAKPAETVPTPRYAAETPPAKASAPTALAVQERGPPAEEVQTRHPPKSSTPAPVAASVPIPTAGPASPAPDAPLDALATGRGRFVWPIRGEIVQRFGPQGPGQRNDGVDIAAPLGAPVDAAAEGTVVYAGPVRDFGNLVLLKHTDGWVTAYANLGAVSVRMRDHVAQGQALGTAGAGDQPHLHFEVRYAPEPKEKARPIDPLALLPH